MNTPNTRSPLFVVPLHSTPIERDVSIDNAKIKPDERKLREIRNKIDDMNFERAALREFYH